MVSGSEFFKDIEGRIRQYHNQLAGQNGAIREVESEVTGLQGERADIYFNLSQVHLPNISSDAVRAAQEQLPELRKRLWSAYEEKQGVREGVQREMDENLIRRQDLQLDLARVTDDLNDLVEQRDVLTTTVHDNLIVNTEYTTLQNKAAELADEIEDNRERLAEAIADSEEKIPEYENDRLFNYLLKRDYGSESYERNTGAIGEFFDGLVAKAVSLTPSKRSWAELRRDYEFLQRVPAHLEKLLEKQTREISTLQDQVAEIEKTTASDVGLTTVMEEGYRIGAERDDISLQITESVAEYEVLEERWRRLESETGEFYQGIAQEIASFLKKESLEELMNRARETEDPQDDRWVGRLYEIADEISGLEERARQIDTQREATSGLLKTAQNLSSWYDDKGFDGSRSYFPSGFDGDDILEKLFLGQITYNAAKEYINSHQKLKPKPKPKPRPTYTSRSRSSRSSSRRRSTSSGGSFGGGFRSSGSIGGGGFSSSGSF